MRIKQILPILLLSLLVNLGGPREANTQTASTAVPCRVGQQAPAIGFWTWAANSRVKVYIRSADFTAAQFPHLLSAVQSWNSVLEQTGSGIKFEYQGNAANELSCDGCLTIIRGPVFDQTRRHVTELKAYSAQHNQLISYAIIIVDPVLTDPRALADALAHEFGHNLGLLDCYTCKSKSTVMNQFKVINKPKDIEGPTRCDIAQVKEAYRELKLRVRPSPPNRNLIDEGEEPEDDDTPVIIPKP
jgi:hypothetical protein